MGIFSFFKKILGSGSKFPKIDAKMLKKSSNGKGNVELSCSECKRNFVFESGEQRFYEQRGLTPPKRCPSCRKRRGGRGRRRGR